MLSTSTPTSSRDTPGSSAGVNLISPNRPAQDSIFRATRVFSWPGMGLVMLPWLSADRRRTVRLRSAGTEGASADNSSVLISRSSPVNARIRAASWGSSGGSSGGSTAAGVRRIRSRSSSPSPFWSSRYGRRRVSYSFCAASNSALSFSVKGWSPPRLITSYRSPSGTSWPSRRSSRWSTRSWRISLSAVRDRCRALETWTRVSMKAGLNG